jgi:hypothetical protein
MAFAVFNKKLIGRGQSTEACDEVVDVSRPNLLGNPFPIGPQFKPRASSRP